MTAAGRAPDGWHPTGWSSPTMVAGDYAMGSKHVPGLSKLIEECGEVLQVAGKIIATNGSREHWDGAGDLYGRLEAELGDLSAAIEFVILINGLGADSIREAQAAKLAQYVDWRAEQAAQ